VLCVAVLCHDFDMEQRTAIKFCFVLGKSASETYELLQKAHGSDSLSRSTTFQWFKRFRNLERSAWKITCENNVHRLLRRSRRDSQ
jgi:hypothetical protein